MTGCQGRSDDELSAQERDEITEAIKQRLDWYREAVMRKDLEAYLDLWSESEEEELRKKLGLRTGVQFVVVGEKDMVILKVISPPSMKEFDSLIREARSKARLVGLKRSDIAAAIAEARRQE
jgi:bifunctional DNA-binding transcriptional regulator/antitoxin component of YhaV-PrlF toxin-antitoxin module